MNSERLIKVLTMDIATDQLRLEDELERTINSDLELNSKILIIKSLLTRMTTNDANLLRFTSMVSNNDNKNNIN